MQYAKYVDKGFTGLANLGNTCFMNSALQALSHTYDLNIFLEKGEYKNKLNKKAESLILFEWDKLRQMMWSENCVISPGGFLGAVQKVAKIKDRTLFTGFAQNDLPEFVDFIINCFHTAISREVLMNINGNVENETDELAKKCYGMMKNMYKKEYSEFLSLFYGISISEISDINGKMITQTPEPFLMINAPIPDKKLPSLKDCLDLFTETEILDGDNKYYNCEKKQHEVAHKEIKFWSFPDNLIIHLKRFSNNLKKNNILVDFPLDNLNLSPYVIGYNKKSFVYELYAICNHSGNVLGGHYTACVKNANGKWYLFNDTQIAEMPKIEMLKTSKAYCFFYRKKKPSK